MNIFEITFGDGSTQIVFAETEHEVWMKYDDIFMINLIVIN